MTQSTRPSTFRRFSLKPMPLALLLAMAPAHHGFAQVFTGVESTVNAAIKDVSSTHTHVTTSGAASMIKAHGFGVGANGHLSVAQDSARSALLIGVTGYDPSFILGQISSNGRVFISNPNGILFGTNARIDVGGLMATTLAIRDEDFLSGRYQFNASTGVGQYAGRVINKGTISSAGGHIVLAGHEVTNEGVLSAPGGRVGLVASDEVLVDVEGDGLLFFNVKAGDARTRLNQLGRIEADGGSVELMAAARGVFADTVLNMGGVVQARSVGHRNGRIVIDGGSEGVTQVSGTLDVSGTDAGETGGRVAVLGDKVALLGQARIDASGDQGGGEVLVGGNVQGSGSERRASRTYVGQNAVIRADALTLGNGGKVVVWADQDTRFAGHVSAQGGALGGNGGFTEVSGHEYLDYLGTVDLSAAQGQKGQLLLDPRSIEIVASAPDRDGDSTGNDLSTPLFNATAGAPTVSKITAAAIKTQLNAADVILTATNDITVSSAINAADNTNSHALTLDSVSGNIKLNADITTRGGLTLKGGNISIDATAVTLNAGTGALVLNGNVVGNNHALTLTTTNTGAAAIDLTGTVSGVTTLDVQANARVAKNVTSSGDQTYAGSVTLTNSAVTLDATGSAGTGKIALNGAVAGNAQDLTLKSNNTAPDAIKTGSTVSGVAVLSVQGKSTLGGNVTTTGNQSYTGEVALGAANVTLDASASAGTGKIALDKAVDGNTRNLTLTSANTAADAIKTSQTIGNVAALTVNGKSTLGGDVSTSGSQNYTGAVKLAANAKLAGASISLTDLDATALAVGLRTDALTISGTATGVGGTATIEAFTGSGIISVAGGAPVAVGTLQIAQATLTKFANFSSVTIGSSANPYTIAFGNVTLPTSTLVRSSSGNISFAKVDGSQALNAQTTGTISLNDLIGGTADLASLTLNGAITLNTASIDTTGVQTYTGAVTLAADTTLNSGGLATFTSTINGDRSLEINGNASFGGNIGATTALTGLDVSGTSAVAGGSITTSGAQVYGGTVTLADDTQFTGGSLSFANINATDDALGLRANALTISGTVTGNSGSTATLEALADNGIISVASGSPVATGTLQVSQNLLNKFQNFASVTIGSAANPYTIAFGDVTLSTSTFVRSSSGNISFAKVDGLQALNAQSTGTISLNDIIGGTADLASLTLNGAITINTASINTTGVQTYTGAVTLARNTTLNSGGLASFSSTVVGARSLDINGNASFGGDIGAGVGNALLSLDISGTTTFTASSHEVSTTGAQTYNGAVTLAGTGAMAFNGGATDGVIEFGSTLIGGRDVAISSKSVEFNGTVGAGGGNALQSLTVTGTAIIGHNITTTAGQTYNNAITLDGNATLKGTALALNGTVNGARNLILEGTAVTLGGAIGTTTALTSLDVTGTTSITVSGGSVITSGDQRYRNAVSLGAATTFSAEDLRFNGNLSAGVHDLTLRISDDLVADGTVTGTGNASIAAKSDATDIVVGLITVANDLQINNVTLNAFGPGFASLTVGTSTGTGSIRFGNYTLTRDLSVRTASGNINFGGTLGGNFDLAARTDSGRITLNGNVGNLASLTLTGATTIDAGSLQTSGAQVYDGAVSLATNVLISGSTVRFNGSIDSETATARSLGVTATSTTDFNNGVGTPLTGAVLFNAPIGQTRALSTLTAGGPVGSTLYVNGNVTTSTSQTWNRNVALLGDTRFRSPTLTFNGSLAAAAHQLGLFRTNPLTVGTLSGTGELQLGTFLNTQSIAVLSGTADALITDTQLNDFAAAGFSRITIGNSTGTGSVTVGTSTSDAFNLSTDLTLQSGTGAITVNAYLYGARNLTANTQGTTTIGGYLGGFGTELSSVVTDAGGSTVLEGVIQTTGAQTYGGNVTLNGTTNLTSTNGLVRFLGTVDSQDGAARALIVQGNAQFDGSVGATAAAGASRLGSVQVTGTTRFNGARVDTTGLQYYAGAATLGHDLVVDTGGTAYFGSTVDGGQSLQINATGSTTLTGAVGAVTQLTSLTTTGGTTNVNGGSVSTSGNQSYSAVQLGSNTTLTGQDIQLANGVNGARTLTITAAGTTTLGGSVGGTTALTSLSTSGATNLDASSVSTSGGQTYGGNVLLGVSTSTTTLNGNTVTFDGTVDGARALVVNDSGTTTFTGHVGSTTALTSLTTSAGGSTTLPASVRTTGAQQYGDSVLLAANTALAANGVTIASLTGANRTLQINSAGNTVFNGSVTGLSSLSSTGAGEVHFLSQAGLNTTGAQNYTGLVKVGVNNAAFSASALTFSAGLRFTDTLIATSALSNTGTNIDLIADQLTLGGAVSGTGTLRIASATASTTIGIAGGAGTLQLSQAALDRLSGFGEQIIGRTDGTGAIRIGSTTLARDTTVRSGTGAVTATGTLDGAHDVVIDTDGLTTLEGNVGATTALASLNISGATTLASTSTAIATSGAQTYTGALTYSSTPTTLSASALTFGGGASGGTNLTLQADSLSLTGTLAGSGVLTLRPTTAATTIGLAGGVGTLQISQALLDQVGGFTSQVIGRADGTGAISAGALTLPRNTTVQSSSGSIGFTSTVDGAHALTANTTGITTFNGNVGATTALASLSTDAGGSTRFNGSQVSTSGAQTYGDALVYTSAATFRASGLNFMLGATGGTDLTLISNTLNFAGPVSGSGTLSIQQAQQNGTIGIAGGTGTLQLTQAMLDQLSGFGQQIIGRTDGTGAIRIGSTTLARDTTVQSGTGNVTATGTLDGAHALVIDTDGATALQGNIGATTALTSLNITGQTTLTGASVTTTGSQTYTGALAYSSTPTTLSASGLTFGAGASGGTDLTLVANSLTLTGSLAGSGVLSLQPTAAATTIGLAGGVGTLQISQALLNQIGGFASQVIGRTDGTGAINAGAITLARNTTVQSNDAAISFNATVDGAHALTVNTTGITTFNGNVGSTTALASLSTNAGGSTRFNGSQVTTSGAQTYGDALVYTSAATFRASGLNFMLGATGGTDLTLISNTLNFAGPVSGSGTLSIQQALQNGTIGIAGGTGTLQLTQAMLDQVSGFSQHIIGRADGTGNITADNVTLTGNTLVQSDTGDISFQDIDGAVALVVNTAGTTTLGGDIGAVTRLSSLTTDAPGNTTIDAGVIRTTGDVLLGDTVNVAGPLTIDATSAGNVTAVRTGNQFLGALTLTAQTVDLFSNSALELAGADLVTGGQIITNGILTLSGDIDQRQVGGSLTLTTNATPGGTIDFTDADLGLTPRFFNSLQLKEARATIVQTGGRINTAEGSLLQLNATAGGSINVDRAGNTIKGQVSAVTPGSSDFSGTGVRGLSFVRLNSTNVAVAGNGIQADAVKITADRLSTAPGSLIRARVPYNNALGVETALPGLTLVLSPTALAASPINKSFGGLLESERILVEIGDATFGGFLTVRPKGGALLGQAYVSLGGPGTIRPFYDGTGKLAEIPVYYNGEVPQTPQEVGALSAVSAVIEEARRSRFEEAVRTENVALRLRSGVIAEVGAGRPATEGSDSIKMPESCTPAANGLGCQ